MKSRKNIILISISIFVGIVLGEIGGPVLILIPWGIVGLTIGIYSTRKRLAVISGGLYGFTTAFTFMMSGYSGDAPIITRIAPFAILGFIGAGCGLMSALIGYLILNSHRNKRLQK